MIDKINIEVLKDFIQSGNINFLIGSGLSRPFLPVLGNIEKQMASVKDAPVNKQEALAAVLYKEYFEKVILPNFKPDYGSKNYTLTHNNYCEFLNIWNDILHNRCSSLRSKQANIFSTNIDLFVESAAETTGVEFNDGFIGSINPVFSEANFQKSVLKNSIHFQNSTELPVFKERSLKRIEDSTLGQDSEEDFGGLFSDIDLASPKLGKTADDKNTLVSNVLLALDDIDFGVEASQEIDILGDAYEYMISQFAAGAGKKAGEFYTPQEVSRILAEIVSIGHQRLRNVYDPTCGSGSLLLRAASIGKAVYIYGQEKNPTTYNLARMNMLLHGIKFSNFKIENGDTLEWDAFGDTQFDAVVANPPFSAEWSAADKFNNDDRFSKAGRLAPKKTADYAFILHMIYHLNEGGTMACVAPHGVLFRGNAEGIIRRFLIEKKNYIDAIIGLPANIFYGTSIPTCILVFKKCRKEDDNILFIDASKEFEKVKTQNKLRPQHIQKIVETYRDRKEIEKYSHLATLKEVADNDYNLNIPRYVDTFEEEEPIDIKAVMAEIKELEAKRAELDKEIEVYLKELGLVD